MSDDGAMGVAQRAVSYKRRSVTVALEPNLAWDVTNYNPGPITLTLVGNRVIGDCAIRPRDFFPTYKAGTLPFIYVSKAGNDSTGTGTQAAPYASLDKAYQVVNAGGVATCIRILGSNTPYYRNAGGTNGNANPLTVSGCVLEAYGGQVTITTSDALTWTANGTYAWVYQVTRSLAASAFWMDRPRLDNGLWEEAKWVGSIAECSRQPGSMYTDGTTTYGYHPTGAAITNANCRLLLNVPNLRVQGTTQISFLMTGQNPGDSIELQGGATGSFFGGFTGGAGGAKVVLGFEHIRFRSPGLQSGGATQPNAFGVEGVNGLVFAYDCDASGGGNDNWNPHNVLGADMSMLLLNCTGTDAGRFAALSCNPLTWHDTNIKLLDVAGTYRGARGWNVYGVGACKVQLIGTTIGGSVGDRAQGGGFDPCELAAGNTSAVYADYVRLEPNAAGALAVATTETATIVLRNPLPFFGQMSPKGGAITQTID